MPAPVPAPGAPASAATAPNAQQIEQLPTLSPVRSNAIFLSIEECIEIAVQNNLGLRINRLNDREVDIKVRVDWARYFPNFTTQLLHQNARPVSLVPEPVTAGTLAPGTNAASSAGVNTLSGGITQTSPFGTTLDFNMDESRNGFERSRASGNLNFNVTQPLWKNASLDVGLKDIRQDRIRRIASRGSLELATQLLIFQVRQEYAEIIRQKQNLDVDNQGVITAKIFYDLTNARFGAGQVTALDVSNAEVQLQNRRLIALQDLRGLVNALDVLKNQMDVDLEENVGVEAPEVDFGDKIEENVTKEILINKDEGVVSLITRRAGKTEVETHELFRAERFDEAVILEEALSNRIDLLNARRAVAIQKLEAAAAKNGLGHEIDLVGGYQRNNAGRSILEGDNGSESHSWSYGVNAKFPWGKIADRGAYETTLVELEKTEIDLKQARTQVQSDIRSILRDLRVAEQSLLIEALAVEQAKRAAEAAQISFERGLQSSFDVINAQNNLLSAKRAFINSRLDYLVDLAQLERFVGKPTGRVNLEGCSVGGLIDSHLPESMREKIEPQRAPDATPSKHENPWNKSHDYREDYSPNRRNPVLVEQDGQ